MKKKFFIAIILLVVSFYPLISHATPAVIVGTSPSNIANPPADLNITSISSLIPKAAALEEDFNKLPERIETLLASQTLNAELALARIKLSSLKSKLNDVKTSGIYSFDKISEIRSPAKDCLSQINAIQSKISEKIKSIESLRQTWESLRTVWENYRVIQNIDSDSVKEALKESDNKIKKAIKLLEGAENPLVLIQKKASELGIENQNFIAEIDAIFLVIRKDLFRRSRPAIFTPRFINQFDKSIWEEFWTGIAALSWPERSFYTSQGWVISLQILGFIMFIWLFGSINIEKATQLKLDFLINRKFSAALVSGIALFYPLYEDLPNIFRFVLLSLMAIGGARLVSGAIESILRKKLICIIVGLFLTFQFCYLIGLPSPIFRIYVALVGIMGAILCFRRARSNKLHNASLFSILTIKACGLIFLIIFVAQAAGYAGFANHLLEVAIKSIFLILIAWIVDLILRGITEALLVNPYFQKSEMFQKHSAHIVRRVKYIVDILTIYFAFSSLLSVWGIYDSPREAVTGLLSWGVVIQNERITLGILITAIALLYLSIFTSWLLQRVLEEEVYPRKKVEPGVGISINRLIHYAFVLFGSIIALSTIKIGLQSLVVLMGAFGIGIGFGLQNIVNNFASGLILLFERSIKVGDVVQINGEWGTIKNLGLRATVVGTFSRSELIVPNSDLVSTTVINWSLSDHNIRIVLPVGVAYGSDVPLVMSILSRVANENPLAMKFPQPTVLFIGFGNSSLNFELRVFSDLDNMLSLKTQLNQEIDRLFRENNIEIPFPQNDLHIRSMDEPFKAAVKELTKTLPRNNKKHN